MKTTAFTRFTLRTSAADARFLKSAAKRPGRTLEGEAARIFALGVKAARGAGKKVFAQ